MSTGDAIALLALLAAGFIGGYLIHWIRTLGNGGACRPTESDDDDPGIVDEVTG